MDTIKVKLKDGKIGYVGFKRGFISIEGPTFWARQKIASIIKSYVRDHVPVGHITRTIGGFKYDPTFSFMMKEMVSSHLMNIDE